ncbi:MAG TPA: 16S rRNA (cytosine(1402)-N(4))-methyltransferase RsmH [Blastocatellia bacterium]|nr:16S rRNA (cytosine(1402)-N(4))-methyltransferase RsmH [Blastocatellia bacterium]
MPVHQPVMPVEALAALDAGKGGLFVDATLGLGGHTELILQASPTARVIGIDRDAEAIALATERLSGFGERFEAVKSDYRQIKTILMEREIESVTGVLADLGVSSFQFDEPERGFSFRSDSPLDMRMDRSQSLTAADLVNGLGERELADLIFQFGEERASRRIARLIVAERAKAAIITTTQLANLVVKAVKQPGHWRIHPATKTFQALRIAVNRELDALDKFVADAVEMLAVGGRLVLITFHSLEDRIIKQALKFQSGHCVCPQSQPVCQCGATKRVEVLTRKAIQPSEPEIAANPRARSAKLRACQKL